MTTLTEYVHLTVDATDLVPGDRIVDRWWGGDVLLVVGSVWLGEQGGVVLSFGLDDQHVILSGPVEVERPKAALAEHYVGMADRLTWESRVRQTLLDVSRQPCACWPWPPDSYHCRACRATELLLNEPEDAT